MALTAVEQISIRLVGIPSIGLELKDVIYQVALNSVIEFQRSEKLVEDNTEAEAYLNKLRTTMEAAYNGSERFKEQLVYIMMSALGRTQYTLAQINGATEAQILSFFKAEMPLIIENVSLISVSEKEAYEAIV